MAHSKTSLQSYFRKKFFVNLRTKPGTFNALQNTINRNMKSRFSTIADFKTRSYDNYIPAYESVRLK